MRQLQLPKDLKQYKYVVIEGELGIFKMTLPNEHTYIFEGAELYDYLMRNFNNDEEFVGDVIAGVENFRRVQVLPLQKHFHHIPHEGVQNDE